MLFLLPLLLGQNNATYLNKTDKSITIAEAIGRIKTDSFGQKILDDKDALSDINLSLERSKIIYPNFNISVGVANHDLVENTSPYQNIRVGFEKYSIFNWGKDKKAYAAAVKTHEAEKAILVRDNNNLRYQGLMLYFRLIAAHQKVSAYDQKMGHASYLYRFNRERQEQGSVSNIDHYRTRDTYLETQNEVRSARVEQFHLSEELSKMMGEEENNINYITESRISVTPLTLDLEAYYEMARMNNKNIMAMTATAEKLAIDHELVLMDSLFLPKIDLNLALYKWEHSTATSTATFDKPKLEASINATWQILGGKGFLNSKVRGQTALNKRIVDYQKSEYSIELKREIQQAMTKLSSQQDKIDVLDSKSLNSKTYFDTALREYVKGQLDINTLLVGLDKMIEDRIENSNAQLEQILLKIQLAELIGVVNLPGEPFENLAIK